MIIELGFNVITEELRSGFRTLTSDSAFGR